MWVSGSHREFQASMLVRKIFLTACGGGAGVWGSVGRPCEEKLHTESLDPLQGLIISLGIQKSTVFHPPLCLDTWENQLSDFWGRAVSACVCRHTRGGGMGWGGRAKNRISARISNSGRQSGLLPRQPYIFSHGAWALVELYPFLLSDPGRVLLGTWFPPLCRGMS